MKKALVTGGTGFVGGHLIQALMRREVAVRALVRKRDNSLPPAVEKVLGDVTGDGVERSAEGCDVVFHCAGVVGNKVTWAAGREVNVDGTRRVARAAREADARVFVHVSSAAVYGFDAGVFDESAPRRKVGEPYADTKAAGEEACEAELAGSKTVLRIIRPPVIYGPGDTGMLAELAKMLRQRVPMIGDGNVPVGLVHITDVIAALIAAAEHEGPEHIFNVAGPDDLTWSELVTMMSQHLRLPPPRRMPRSAAVILSQLMRVLAGVRLLARPPLTPHVIKFLTEERRYPTTALSSVLGVIPAVSARAHVAQTFPMSHPSDEPSFSVV